MEHKEKTQRLVNQAQGQMNAVLKMVEDDRYCIDVSYQILATIAQLKKANEELMREHMKNCVTEAFEEGHGDEKIDEVVKIISKLID